MNVGPSAHVARDTTRLALVTCSGRTFGQGLKAWISLDVARMRASLEGHGFDVSEYSFDEIAEEPTAIQDSLVFYSSTQRPGYKDYLEDVLLTLEQFRNVLVPSFHMFRAHENKGYQEILKLVHGISDLRGAYVSSGMELKRARWNEWPAVLKWPEGAKSTGVALVSSIDEAAGLVAKGEKLSLSQRVRALVRSYVVPKPGGREWYEYITPRQRFVLQQFIPGLKRDFKVLVFGDRYYVLERKVRSNDFRASGSGQFAFLDPPHGLLDYAESVFNRFGEPFLSLDICEAREGYALLEFQGVHLGPVTLVKSPFHFRRHEQGSWEKVNGEAVLEDNYGDAIAKWVRERCGARL